MLRQGLFGVGPRVALSEFGWCWITLSVVTLIPHQPLAKWDYVANPLPEWCPLSPLAAHSHQPCRHCVALPPIGRVASHGIFTPATVALYSRCGVQCSSRTRASPESTHHRIMQPLCFCNKQRLRLPADLALFALGLASTCFFWCHNGARHQYALHTHHPLESRGSELSTPVEKFLLCWLHFTCPLHCLGPAQLVRICV